MNTSQAYILGIKDATEFCVTILRGCQIDDSRAAIVNRCFQAAADVMEKHLKEVMVQMLEEVDRAFTEENAEVC